MVIKGNIYSNNHAYLQLSVKGTGKPIKITAMFDCGYGGSLCLPLSMAIELELKLANTTSFELADGSIVTDAPVCKGKIRWNRKWTDVEVDLTNSEEPLLGVSLPALVNGRITMDYSTGKFTIEM